MMRYRDWPPPSTDPYKPPVPDIMVEVLIAVGLFVLSPLASWFVAAVPGQHPWAATLWPAGWALTAIVVLVGVYIRGRRPR